MTDSYSKIERTPKASGTGLIALDVLIGGNGESWPATVGGSCANVLTILSFLGWASYPIAYFGEDRAAQLILRDFEAWGVDQSLVKVGRPTGTPIVVERLQIQHGIPTHRFEFNCPNCNTRLPQNRPIPFTMAKEFEKGIPRTDVFYFDRASKAALGFARTLRDQGSLIMFEPARVGSNRIFRECLKIAHIVKYSYDQIENLNYSHNSLLEVQTLGAEGLRYRYLEKGRRNSKWHRIAAFPVREYIDSAGAGDWCTAGFLNLVARWGSSGLEAIKRDQLEFSLRFGQALAALNCEYEGPRGLMYHLGAKEVLGQVDLIMKGSTFEGRNSREGSQVEGGVIREVCRSCASESEQRVLARDPPFG